MQFVGIATTLSSFILLGVCTYERHRNRQIQQECALEFVLYYTLRFTDDHDYITHLD